MLSSYLRLALPGGLLPIIFLSKTLYTPLTPPPHVLVYLDLIARKIFAKEYNP